MIALDRALVIADGFANGHVPMTETVPAPLIPVAGRAPIDSALDRIAAQGIATAIVAAHRHATRIAAHVAGRAAPHVETLALADRLGSGGTIAHALANAPGGLGAAPFLVVAANAVRLDGATPALARLAAAWNDDAMDALLLVHATVSATGVPQVGEIFVDPAGRARLRVGNEVAPFAYAGTQIVHPRLFAGAPAGAFAVEALWTRASETERLWAVISDGALCRVASAAARDEAEEALEALGVWRRPRDRRAAS